MFPVRMMLMYWSAVARLRNIPEPTVDATTLTVFFMNRTNTEVMLPSIPLAVIAPPKHMAQIMSHIVFIIPAMAPCGNQLSQHGTVTLQAGTAVQAHHCPFKQIIVSGNLVQQFGLEI